MKCCNVTLKPVTNDVKPAVATRWNSNLRMLQSVSKNVSRLRDIANDETDKKLQRLLIDVNDQLLTEVIDILHSFTSYSRQSATEEAAGCKVL